MNRRPTISTCTDTLVPYTTPFRSFLTGGQRRTRGGVDDARRDISMNPADRTALFGPMLAEIIDRPAGDRARKFGRAIIGADRDIIFFEEGIDQIGRERRGARDQRAKAERKSVVEGKRV